MRLICSPLFPLIVIMLTERSECKASHNAPREPGKDSVTPGPKRCRGSITQTYRQYRNVARTCYRTEVTFKGSRIWKKKVYRRRPYSCHVKVSTSAIREKIVPICCNGEMEKDGGCVECPRTKFGTNCSQECRCNWSNTLKCNPITGECQCHPGFTGKQCQLECSSRKYGVECSKDCQCKWNNTYHCDSVNGSCHCNPGYIGPRCGDVCKYGYHGDTCKDTCNCTEGHICSHVNGLCSCNPNVTEDLFDYDHHTEIYMKDCQHLCSCDWNNTEYCDVFHRDCICKLGWNGHNCASESSHLDAYTDHSYVGSGRYTAIGFAIFVFVLLTGVATWYCKSVKRAEQSTPRPKEDKNSRIYMGTIRYSSNTTETNYAVMGAHGLPTDSQEEKSENKDTTEAHKYIDLLPPESPSVWLSGHSDVSSQEEKSGYKDTTEAHKYIDLLPPESPSVWLSGHSDVSSQEEKSGYKDTTEAHKYIDLPPSRSPSARSSGYCDVDVNSLYLSPIHDTRTNNTDDSAIYQSIGNLRVSHISLLSQLFLSSQEVEKKSMSCSSDHEYVSL